MLKTPLLILGMGNKLLSDDGAGIVAAEALQELLGDSPEIKVESTSWGGMRIIDLFENFNSAIVIDAIQTGKKPFGHIHLFKHSDLINSVRMVSFHDVNFATAIELAKALEIKMPEEIYIYAIEVEKTNEFSESLTPLVAAAVNKCINIILKKLSHELNIELSHKKSKMKV